MGRRGAQALAVVVLAVLTASSLSACEPPSVRIEAVVPNLDFPAGFTIDPNNVTFWYAERNTGEIRRHNLLNGNDQLVWTVPNVVTSGEQGVLGIALHTRSTRRGRSSSSTPPASSTGWRTTRCCASPSIPTVASWGRARR
jgi:hypothetical protein